VNTVMWYCNWGDIMATNL